MNFQDLYALLHEAPNGSNLYTESKFKDSRFLRKRLGSWGGFTFYLGSNTVASETEVLMHNLQVLQQAAFDAQKQISQIGFTKMGVNVVIKKLDANRINHVTGHSNNTAGYASGGRRIDNPFSRTGKDRTYYGRKTDNPDVKYKTSMKYMVIDLDVVLGYLKHPENLVSLLVHEWAHVWMFNKGNKFYQAIDKLFEQEKSRAEPSYMQYFNSSMFGDFENQYVDMIVKKFKAFIYWFYIGYFHNRDMQEDDPFHYARTTNDEYIKNEAKNLRTLIDEIESEIQVELNLTYYHKERDKFIVDVMNALTGAIPEVEQDEEIFSQIKDHTDKKFADKLYTKVWYYGKHKSQELSIVNFFKRYYMRTQVEGDLEGQDKKPYREFLAEVMKWPRGYGMANYDEYWATAIEDFFELNLQQKQKIVKAILDS